MLHHFVTLDPRHPAPARRLGRAAAVIATVAASVALGVSPAQADDDAPAPAAASAPATPSQVDAAVTAVSQMVAGIESSTGRQAPHAYTVAMATLDYVQTNVSSAIYAYRGANGLNAPITAEQALAERAGICGNQVEVYLEVLARLGGTAQPAQFFFTADGQRQNHVGAEVQWDGGWHYVDVSYGAVFWKRRGDLLSLDALLKDPKPMRWAHTNETDAWTGSALLKGWKPYAYLQGYTRREVVHQGSGTVTPLVKASTRTVASEDYDLTLLPDYVGTGAPYAGVLENVSFRLQPPKEARKILLAVRTQGCPAGGQLRAGSSRVDLATVPWSGQASIALPAGDRGAAVTLSVVSNQPGTPCEIVIDGLSAAA
jgi:hypothetical protein